MEFRARVAAAVSIAACAVVLATTPVAAAPVKPVPDAAEQRRDTEARAHYQTGLSRFDVGDFDVAISEFKQAYAINGSPALLFNIAQSARLKKDYEQALHAYRSFLRLEPTAANRADVEAFINDCERALSVQRRTDPLPATSEINFRENSVVPLEPLSSDAFRSSAPPPLARKGPLSWLIGGGVLIGLGGGLLVGATATGVRAQSESEELRRLVAHRGAWSPDYQNVYEDGRRSAAIGDALLAVGAVAAIAGVTLLALGVRRVAVARPSFAWAPSGRAIEAAWRF